MLEVFCVLSEEEIQKKMEKKMKKARKKAKCVFLVFAANNGIQGGPHSPCRTTVGSLRKEFLRHQLPLQTEEILSQGRSLSFKFLLLYTVSSLMFLSLELRCTRN